jgi:hypothetical protein
VPERSVCSCIVGSQRPLVFAIAVFFVFLVFGLDVFVEVIDEFEFWADTTNPVLANAATIITTSPRP